jgi:hypothetical protein
VSGVADSDQGTSVVGTVMLGLLIFGLGAAAGFLGRLLWPHPR